MLLSARLAAALLAAACAQEGGEELYLRIAAARGMGAEPPATPAQHYFLRGKVRFLAQGVGELVQECEIGLGGPARLRHTVRSGSRSQIFLLESAGRAWVRRREASAFEPCPAMELAQEAWARWTLARFPWGHREALREAPRRPLPGGGQEVALEGAFGAFTVALAADGRPAGLRLGSLELRVEEDGAGPGPRFPRRWTWRDGEGERVEEFEHVDAGALFLDEAFRPPGAPTPQAGWGAMRFEPGAEPVAAADEIGIVERPAARALLGPWPADWAAPLPAAGAVETGLWQVVDPEAAGGASSAAAILRGAAPAELPPGVTVREVPAGRFLRWVTWSDLDARDAAARLRQAAERSRLSAAGPAWVLVVPGDGRRHRREALLPLQP